MRPPHASLPALVPAPDRGALLPAIAQSAQPAIDSDGQAAIHFLGHATTLVDMAGVRLLTDPVLRERVAHLRHRALPAHPAHPVDAVLISHLHQDHLDRRSLERLGHSLPLLVPRGAGALLERWGFRDVREMAVGERVTIGGVRVLATPASHSGFRPPFGPRAECLGFIAEGVQRVYFAGDTDLFPEMSALGPLDVALLPVWGWGPNLGPGHLDPERAAIALTLLEPRVAVPVHWGSLHPIGLHRWMRTQLTRPPHEFAALARGRAPGVQVRVLRPGEQLRYTDEGWHP